MPVCGQNLAARLMQAVGKTPEKGIFVDDETHAACVTYGASCRWEVLCFLPARAAREPRVTSCDARVTARDARVTARDARVTARDARVTARDA
eukprot:1825648-Prymnesium_polylepis.1